MVRVEDFKRQFSDLKTKLPYKLNRDIVDFSLVGSTKHNGEGNDYDVVVLVNYHCEMVYELELLGWTIDSNLVGNQYPDTFTSMRKGNFNLLITEEDEFFQRMENASEVVRKVQDMFECELDRRDVCDIYSLILYGHPEDE